MSVSLKYAFSKLYKTSMSLTSSVVSTLTHPLHTESYVTVKVSEDRILPRLSVEKSGHVKLHFDTWLHGKRILRHYAPTKAIYKAHKANQVSKIKRLLDNTNVSLEQIDSILQGLQG
jgi:hypothetical protein